MIKKKYKIKKRYKVLGLIPARGGSKGIKNKNVINLAGKPLIVYAIVALKKSKAVDKIVCTTDSELIAETAKKYGAEVPFLRPKELAQDFSPVYPALAHAVRKLEKLQNYKPDYIVMIQPTSPLVQPEQISAAVKMAIKMKADSVITAVDLEHDTHPYNIREILPDGRIKFWMEKEHYQFPTRQSKPQFRKFGNLYVSSYDTLIKKRRLEGEKNYALKIDKNTTLDINILEDVKEIEYFLKNKKRLKKNVENFTKKTKRKNNS